MSYLGKDVLLGVNEVAKKCKITKQGVRKAIKDKRLSAIKIGNSWVIHPFDLLYFKARTGGQ